MLDLESPSVTSPSSYLLLGFTGENLPSLKATYFERSFKLARIKQQRIAFLYISGSARNDDPGVPP